MLEVMELHTVNAERGKIDEESASLMPRWRLIALNNTHPTVESMTACRYLPVNSTSKSMREFLSFFLEFLLFPVS